MARTITISFKEDDRDMKLLTQIKDQRDKSNFIKEAVEYFLQNKNNPSKIIEMPKNNTIQENIKYISKDDKEDVNEVNQILDMFGGM